MVLAAIGDLPRRPAPTGLNGFYEGDNCFSTSLLA
jgi:hypothetical protein